MPPFGRPRCLCFSRWTRKAIMGKHFGRGWQCPNSLPKPIFVIETTCHEPGTTPRKPKMKLKLWDLKEPNDPHRSSKKTADKIIKAAKRHPKVTPNDSFWGPGNHLGTCTLTK